MDWLPVADVWFDQKDFQAIMTARIAEEGDWVSSNQMILNINGLELTVGRKGIQHKVIVPSCTVSRGQIALLMGPSGSGKSVFMKTLAGIMQKPEVDITGLAEIVDSKSQKNDLFSKGQGFHATDREEIFYLFQDPRSYLQPRLTVDNYRVLLEHRLPDRSDIKTSFEEYLAMANLRHRKTTLAGQLSGGEAQRLMLAIMSILRPRLILADEPLSAQDRVHHEQLRQLLNLYVEDQGNDCAMVLVTHEMRDIEHSIRDGSNSVFYVLEQDNETQWSCSEAIFAGEVAQAIEQAKSKVQMDSAIPKTLRSFFSAGTELGLIGDEVQHQKGSDGSDSMPILEAKNVSFGWAKRKRSDLLLHNINITHFSNQNLGLMGLSGVGKSTLAEILLGLVDGQDGTVQWFGRTKIAESEFRERVQYVFQDCERALGWEEGTLEEVMLSPFRSADRTQASQMAGTMNEILEDLGLSDKRLNLISHLSGGQQRRAFLARALLVVLANATEGAPTVLVLDEATVGLDLTTQVSLLRLLNDYSRNRYPELSLVVISHDPVVLRYICDEFLIISRAEDQLSGATIIEKLNRREFGVGPYQHRDTALLVKAL